MSHESPLTVLVASYISREHASTDLASLDDGYWTADVNAYDAALVVTDAWNQIHVEGRAGRAADDVSVGPLHGALTSLFGGPFIGGKAPPPPRDSRISERGLLRLALGLPADTVLIMALGKVEDSRRSAAAFPHAERVEFRTLPGGEKSESELVALISQLVVESAEQPR